MTIHVHQQAEESDENLIISKGEEEHECGAATFMLPSNSQTSEDDDFKERSSSCKGVYDASGEMKQLCEAMALKDVSKSSFAIAMKLRKQRQRNVSSSVRKMISLFLMFSLIFLLLVLVEMPYRYLETSKLKALVHQCRRSEFNDWEGIISSYPLVNCANDDERLFLQFNTVINVGNKLQKIIGFEAWGAPSP